MWLAALSRISPFEAEQGRGVVPPLVVGGRNLLHLLPVQFLQCVLPPLCSSTGLCTLFAANSAYRIVNGELHCIAAMLLLFFLI